MACTTTPGTTQENIDQTLYFHSYDTTEEEYSDILFEHDVLICCDNLVIVCMKKL